MFSSSSVVYTVISYRTFKYIFTSAVIRKYSLYWDYWYISANLKFVLKQCGIYTTCVCVVKTIQVEIVTLTH